MSTKFKINRLKYKIIDFYFFPQKKGFIAESCCFFLPINEIMFMVYNGKKMSAPMNFFSY